MSAAERLAGLVVRLYRPSARDGRHAEIVSTVRDALDGQGRMGAARELADLAAHGVRHRMGLTASSPAGRTLAAAAPLAVASGVALSALFLLCAEWDWRPPTLPDPDPPNRIGPFATLGPLVYLPWLLMLPAAAFGLRRLTRTLAALATATSAALLPLTPPTGADRPPLWALGALALFALIVLAAPADPLAPERPDPRPAPLLAAAMLAVLTVGVFADGSFWRVEHAPDIPDPIFMSRPLWYRYTAAAPLGTAIVVALVIGLLAALVLARRHPTLPVAVLVTAFPWAMVVYGLNAAESRPLHDAVLWTCLLAAAATAGGAAVRMRAARRVTDAR
ncbi:hypothetical protein [Actinomadura rayongensis]|uniref:Uncharacterized protein n=1 Tax=Actinomadura rayongensis TaxID=1429076 RepID=A0A6I4W958_9ACTN|nr:hypothetical protein [Actinomadura rayongensis]MXQ67349.1 hypothetical protein [Actinomadura rayongensis]